VTKYRVYLQTVASTSIEVDIVTDGLDDEEAREMAIEAAFESDLPSLCAHCSGLGSRRNLELGDNWEIPGNASDAVERIDGSEVTP
jgi:hypothetical protein